MVIIGLASKNRSSVDFQGLIFIFGMERWSCHCRPYAKAKIASCKHDQQNSSVIEISKRWTLLHIPKTAGESLMVDSPKHLPIGTTLKGNVEKELAGTPKIAPILVLLREPTSHVLSQFLECKYDPYFQKIMTDTRFPGMGRLDDVMGGFDEWIQHFVDAVRQENYGDFTAFHCYDPYNMQSRYLTAGGSLNRQETDFPHFARNREDRFPSVDVAKENLMNKIHLVGIVKYYAASLCLLEYHAMGGQLVTPECQVCDETTRKIALATSDKLAHHTHGVPPHSIDVISNQTRALIEGEMTLTDQELYRTGLELFEKDVDAVYKATGVDLLCRRRAPQPPARAFAENLTPSEACVLPLRSTRCTIWQLKVAAQLICLSGLLGLVVWMRVAARCRSQTGRGPQRRTELLRRELPLETQNAHTS